MNKTESIIGDLNKLLDMMPDTLTAEEKNKRDELRETFQKTNEKLADK